MLIGKGVTFDSGGINIKHSDFSDMKTDMLDDEMNGEKEDRDEDWIECIEMEIDDLKEMLTGLYKIKLERL